MRLLPSVWIDKDIVLDEKFNHGGIAALGLERYGSGKGYRNHRHNADKQMIA